MLAINIGKSGARYGADHPRVKIRFEVVEKARDLHEKGVSCKEILRAIEVMAGQSISNHTLQSWLRFQTRIYG